MVSLWLSLLACGGEEKTDVPNIPVDTSNQDVECDQSVDSDCDGVLDADDCDPNDGLVYPGAPEIPYDGKDNDCAGDGDLNDVDGDGHIGISAGGDDCNDNNDTVYVGAPEICYDGIDQDCAGDLEAENANDCDADGHIGRGEDATDCNDEDPTINADQEEIWYDNVDQNCDSWSDFDSDFDGDDHIDFGGGDCDDEDPLTSSLFIELWDGVDRNCDDIVDELNVYDSYKNYFPISYALGYLGSSFAPLDDYDGDGFKELLIGSPVGNVDSSGGPADGSVYGLAHVISTGVPDGDPNAVAYGDLTQSYHSYFGWDMAAIGDLDGDGLTEVVVGEPVENQALILSGALLSQGGSVDGPNEMAKLTGVAFTGMDVQAAGDVDGDGIPDVAAGVGGYYDGTSFLGVWSGSDILNGGTLGQGDALVVVNGSGQGGQITGGLDFDGDGFSDMVTADGVSYAGKVAIVPGSVMGSGANLSVVNDLNTITASSNTRFGRYNAAIDDMDGDGYAELLTSAPSKSVDGLENVGVVYMIDGDDAINGGSAANLAMMTIVGSIECGNLIALDVNGDYDGDGVPDLMVSSINDASTFCTSSTTPYARTRVFLGGDIIGGVYDLSDSVPSDLAQSTFISRNLGDQLGSSGVAFDMDGDGKDDIALGAPMYEDGDGYVLLFQSALP